MDLKLFKATCVSSGYGWTKTEWEKHFLSNDIEIVKTVVRDTYGDFDKYYRYDEAEQHITFEELPVETLIHNCTKERYED